jgi:para-nitrobenzyl esterase
LLAIQDFQGAYWTSVIDNHYFTEAPEATYAASKAAKVPLLVGSNSQEGGADSILRGTAPTVENYRTALRNQFAGMADRMFDLYPAAQDSDVIPAATALASDLFIAASTWNWFDHQRRTGAPAYYYYYTHVRPAPTAFKASGPPAYGALHSAEIEYALGNLGANPAYAWADADHKVSATMNGYFVNLIKTGDPNGKGLPSWPKAPAGDGPIRRQVIDVDTTSAAFPEQARYVALLSLLTGH